jgi:hypothetical protein
MALGNNPVMAAEQQKNKVMLPYNPVMEIDPASMVPVGQAQPVGYGSSEVIPPPPSAPGLDYRAQNKLEMAKGGLAEGGMLQEGGTVDPVSGNEVPVGSLQEEVRDDIPAQLSEGEFVFPADVVRFIGLEKLMQLRQTAKEGLAKMEAMGQMSNSEEATMDDDVEFESEIDNILKEVEGEEDEEEMER